MNHGTNLPDAGTPGNAPHVAKTVPQAFDNFDQELDLDRKQRDDARIRATDVDECLVVAGIATSTFIQGSFGRKTMLKPLKDVDIVVLLSKSYRRLLDTNAGPATAMQLVAGVVAQGFPDVTFDVGEAPAKALRVSFPDLDFTFDLVVAFDTPGGGQRIAIGNRETDEWEPSNTRRLTLVVQTRNVKTGGKWVHEARMLKAFKAQRPVLKEHCGLLYEALLYQAVTKAMSHPDGLATVLRHAATAVRGRVFDPTHEDDLTTKWTPELREATAAAFAAAAKQAQEALDLAADGEQEAAVGVWNDILGEQFPAPPTPSVADTFRGLAGGSITSTGAAVTSTRGRQSARPTRPWRSS